MRMPRKMCNVTHFLCVIGQNVLRLPFRMMCNITHMLFILEQDDETDFQKNVQCHSLPVHHMT
jgi:hypothetical protein